MRWTNLHDDERGIALISVLGVSVVLAILLTGLLSYGVGSMRQANDDQDWHASLSSAEAGLDDFLYRVNRDNNYWEEADPDWNGGTGTPDPSNPALAGFTPVPGDDTDGAFTYEVDASDVATTGNIMITVTGQVDGEERTVRAAIRRRGFLNYLYFTDFETLDPTAYPTTGTRDQDWAAENCAKHRYAGRHSDCIDIYWYGDDTRQDRVDGPFHTNDTIAVSGQPVWLQETTTSDKDRIDAWLADPDNNLPYFERSGGTGEPSFPPGSPRYDEPLEMPPSNDEIKAKADPVVGGEGCMYVGPTYVRLDGDQMYVTSAQTEQPGRCPIDGVTPADYPDNGVLYVRSKTSGDPCSPQPHPYDLSEDITVYDCRSGDVFVQGVVDGRLTIASENNIVITDDVTYAGGRGVGSDDMLGLVANNFVEVMHPVREIQELVRDGRVGRNGSYPQLGDGCDDVEPDPGRRDYCLVWEGTGVFEDIAYLPGGLRFEEPFIDAALLSVAHSFRVQKWQYGTPMDELHVFGAMAQIFRGPVGTFSGTTTVSGYQKDYAYDTRLKYISPPHFIDPVKSAWGVAEWSEESS